MGWLFFLIGALVVVVIALVAVGQVVGRLQMDHPPAVYEVAVAAEWIGNRLPDEISARLSYADVALVLGWHLDWFNEVGVASRYGEELAGEGVVQEGAVAVEDAAVDAVVTRAMAESKSRPNSPIDALDIVCVLDLQMRYLVAIGAVGAEVDRRSNGLL